MAGPNLLDEVVGVNLLEGADLLEEVVGVGLLEGADLLEEVVGAGLHHRTRRRSLVKLRRRFGLHCEESAPESPSNFDLAHEGSRCSPLGSPSFDIIASDVIDSTSDSGDYY